MSYTNPRFKRHKPEYSSILRWYDNWVLKSFAKHPRTKRYCLIFFNGKMQIASKSLHRHESAYKMRRIWRLIRIGKKD